MNTEANLRERSNNQCELCSNTNNLTVYEVPGHEEVDSENSILICDTCAQQIVGSEALDTHHWRCLSNSMWSNIPAVQVMAWRLLKRLRGEMWAQELLDTLYLDEATQAWAESGIATAEEGDHAHIDSNGSVLHTGDSVTLIKDLNVKGTSFTAKRGTIVKKISLVQDNAEQIEGRINGQQIVILTKFVKKNRE